MQAISKKIGHIILAAGSSSRMGSPKQLLPWKSNSSLILHEIEKSLSLKKLTTFVVLGANFEMIEKEIIHLPVEILYNQHWQSGMGTSISCGLRHILQDEVNVEGVLITLIDQPMIDENHLKSLISKFDKGQEGIVATITNERIGVPAIFSSQYFDELSVLNNDYGARQIIKKYKKDISTINGKGKTDDIDTIEQYKALLERVKE
ncbi:nucleotidyltransferase family protein [Aquimarina sp. M1]